MRKKTLELQNVDSKVLLLKILKEQLDLCDKKVGKILEEISPIFMEEDDTEELNSIEIEKLDIYEKIGQILEND